MQKNSAMIKIIGLFSKNVADRNTTGSQVVTLINQSHLNQSDFVCLISRLVIFICLTASNLIVSTIGAVSIIKAVYIDKRSLKCACVGGGSSVPLGFISLTENLMMMAMAIWMIIKAI